MHGLVNRAIQCFLRDTYGEELWTTIVQRQDIPPAGFEAVLTYEPELTEAVLQEAGLQLEKPRHVLLEDLGTYLVSSPNVAYLRSLLRFSGSNFVEFLHSLDDLPRRAALAVPDLEFPTLEVIDHDSGSFNVRCQGALPGFGHALVGIIRAMADDYGALVLLDHDGSQGPLEQISVQVLENQYSSGREFVLTVQG